MHTRIQQLQMFCLPHTTAYIPVYVIYVCMDIYTRTGRMYVLH